MPAHAVHHLRPARRERPLPEKPHPRPVRLERRPLCPSVHYYRQSEFMLGGTRLDLSRTPGTWPAWRGGRSRRRGRGPFWRHVVCAVPFGGTGGGDGAVRRTGGTTSPPATARSGT